MTRAGLLVVIAACASPRELAGDAAVASDVGIDVSTDAPSDASIALGDPFVALQALPGSCTSDNWCWQFPKPQGNRYFQVFGTGPDNIWLTGAKGTVLEWDGHVWTTHHPPSLPGQDTVEWPFWITGTSNTDMWLILGSAVEHWNGSTWSFIDTGPINVAIYFHSMWSAPDGEVWSISMDGVKRSQDGTSFDLIYPAPNLTSVWGAAADDVYVSGPGAILHYDGAQFTEVYSGPGFPGFLQGFTNDVWASGGNATLLHFDGTTWTAVPTGISPNVMIQTVSARASNDVWWLAGSDFLHWDGTSLTATPITTLGDPNDCCATRNAAAIIDDRWWIVGGDGTVFTKVGGGAISPIIAPAFLPTAMWGTSDDDMYFGASKEIDHWDGTTMTKMPIAISGGGITGVAGTGIGGASELFSVGFDIDWDTLAYVYSGLHYDGQTWTKTEILHGLPDFAGPYLGGAYAMGPNEAMVVGTTGLAFHYKDGTWTPVASGVTTDLAGIWGPDRDHLWITGRSGTLLTWSSANPGVMTPDSTFPFTTDDLGAISGADDNMWIADPNTEFVWRLDQTTTGWSKVNTNVIVKGVYAVDSRNVVATTTSDDGVIARWDGNEFVIESYGYETVMYSVFQPPNGKMWLTNGEGIVRHP